MEWKYFYSVQKPDSIADLDNFEINSFHNKKWIIPDINDLLFTAFQTFNDSDDSIVVLIDNIIEKAILLKASDIHFEHHNQVLNVRFRIDGVLKKFYSFKGENREKMIARLKLLASMDITEKRRPQDGRIKKSIAGKVVDIRVSSLPTAYGERLVLRILDVTTVKLNLDELGIEEHLLTILKRNLKKMNGLILVTGPTGSGKTTTLYSALNYVKNEMLNIMTVEDPIEYKLEGISQTQVAPEIGFDFANSLRSILRQDPDVILIGEIRDEETLSIALRSAITGHLVLSTLHTNSALSSIVRLKDLGAETYMIISSLNLVIAQRLVRRLCPNCKSFLKTGVINNKKINFYHSKGCEKCNGTGYLGRTPIFEFIEFDEQIKEMILKGESDKMIYKYLIENQGFEFLSEKILKLVDKGETSIYEAEKIGIF